MFEGKVDTNALDSPWLDHLEGYFYIHNFSIVRKITFALQKSYSCVKHWQDSHYVQNFKNISIACEIEPTWGDFVDAYYPVGNYNNQYMRWTTLH